MLGNEQLIALSEIPPHDESHHRPKNTPFEAILALKRKYPNISQRHLGKMVGISGAAVALAFMRNGVDYLSGQVRAVEEFKQHRADILALHQINVLNELSKDKLKKASARDLTVTFGILHDHERLERGQSTGAIEVNISGLITAVAGPSRGLIRDQPGVIVQATSTIYGGAGNSNDTSNS